jgi:hypothetical protein
MTEQQIVDIWTFFKEHIDKKQLSIVAEQYIDVLADLGTDDIELKSSLGNCGTLDTAINYYLDLDEVDYDE